MLTGIPALIGLIYGGIYVRPEVSPPHLDPNDQFRFPFAVTNRNLATLYNTYAYCTVEDLHFNRGRSIEGGCGIHLNPAQRRDLRFGDLMPFYCPVLGDAAGGPDQSFRFFEGEPGVGVERLRIGVVVEYDLHLVPGLPWRRAYSTEYMMQRQRDGIPVWIETGRRPAIPDRDT